MGSTRAWLRRLPCWMGAGFVGLGCGGKVVLDGSSGAGGTGGGGAGGTGAGSFLALVVPTLDAEAPCHNNPQLNPPGAVFFLVSNAPITCADDLPVAFDGSPCASAPFVWEACVAVAPSALAVGSIDLTSAGVNAEEEDTGGECASTCCSTSTILSGGGTLDITAVDASQVSFTFSDADATLADGTVDLNGTYTAPRCP